MDELLKQYIKDIRLIKDPGPVEGSLRLAISIAKKYCLFDDDELMDLIQEGNIGLIEAFKKYSKKFKCKFSTYAYNWIKVKIARFMEKRKREKLAKAINNDDAFIDDVIYSKVFYMVDDPESETIKNENRNAIVYALNSLKERERLIILLRFGFFGKEFRLKELGQALGISAEHVRRIEQRVILKIKNRLFKM